MVDHMSVEGGPGNRTNVKKIALIVAGVLLLVVILASLAVVFFVLSHTISCHDEDVKFYVSKVDLPTIGAADPLYTCVAQGSRTIQFQSTGVYSYNDDLPTLTVGNVTAPVTLVGEGTDLEIQQQSVLTYTQFEAEVPSQQLDQVTIPMITLAQPVPNVPSSHAAAQVPAYVEKGCTATVSNLILVPAPTVDFVHPRVMCRGTTQSVIVDGKHMVFVTGDSGSSGSSDATTAMPAATTTAAGRKRQMTSTNANATVASTTTAAATTTAAGNATTTTAAPATTTAATSTAAGATTTAPAPMPTTGNPADSPPPGDSQVTSENGVSYSLGNSNVTAGITGTICETQEDAASLQLCSQLSFEVNVDDVAAEASAVDFVISNPDPIGCTSPKYTVRVIDTPEIISMDPPLLLVGDEPAQAKLVGSGFIQLDDRVPTITFTAGGRSVNAVDVTTADCPIKDGGLSVCDSLRFTIPAGTVFDTAVDVSVEQPSPISGCGQTKASFTAFIKPPSIVVDPLICGGRSLVLNGTFYNIDGTDTKIFMDDTLIEFELDDQSGTIIGEGLFIEIHDSITIPAANFDSIFNAMSTEAKTPTITLVQDDLIISGPSTFDDLFTFVPPMRADTKPFPGICNNDETLSFIGDWFVQHSGAKPTVDFDSNTTVILESCEPFPTVSAIQNAERCKVMKVIVATPPASTQDMTLRNAAPLQQCTETLAGVQLTTVPQINAGFPVDTEVCLGGIEQTVSLTGSFPVGVNGTLPLLVLQDANNATKAGVVFDQVTCKVFQSNNDKICTEIEFLIDDVTAAANLDKLPYGDNSLVAQVRATDECGSRNFTLTGKPVGRVSAVMPRRICAAVPTTLTITGSLIDVAPVFLLPRDAPATTIVSAANATNCVDGVCTGLTTVVDTTALRAYVADDETTVNVGVRNGLTCASSDPGLLTVVPQPVITGLKAAQDEMNQSPQICHDQNTTLTIEGNGFSTKAMLEISLIADDPMGKNYNLTTFVVDSNTKITVTLTENTIDAGFYAVRVQNMEGCVGETPNNLKLHVHPVLEIREIWPSVLPPNLDVTAQVHISGVVGEGEYAGGFLNFVTSATDMSTALSSAVTTGDSKSTFTTRDVATMSFIQDTAYFLKFVSRIGCTALSSTGMFTVKAPTPTTATLSTPYGNNNTEVVVARSAGSKWGIGTLIYASLPNSNVEPQLLREQHLIDDGAAVRGILDGQAFGAGAVITIYAVDSVNGLVSETQDGFIFGGAPQQPQILQQSPSSLRKKAGTQTISLVVNVKIAPDLCEFRCVDSSGQSTGAALTCSFANTSTESPTVSVDVSTLDAGVMCHVYAAEGGVWYTSAPFAIVDDSDIAAGAAPTLRTFGTALNVDHDGGCGVVVHGPSRSGAVFEQFAVVIGGGTKATEAARITAGAPVFKQSTELVESVQGAGCAVLANEAVAGVTVRRDRYVYVVGGRNTAQVQRARILHPAEAPTLQGALMLNNVAPTLPASATFRYVVTGVMSSGLLGTMGTLSQSDGQSLPSNEVQLAVPAGTPDARFQLSWTLPAGAAVVGHNFFVYRATGLDGAFELLAQVDGDVFTYIDDGMTTPNATLSPPPPGGLGAFSAISKTNAPTGNTWTAIQTAHNKMIVAGEGAASPNLVQIEQTAHDSFDVSVGPSAATAKKNPALARFYGTDRVAVVGGDAADSVYSVTPASAFSSSAVSTSDLAGAMVSGYTCGVMAEAGGDSKMILVGGSDARTFRTIDIDASGAVVAGTPTDSAMPVLAHTTPACARAGGQLLLAGGAGTARSVSLLVI